ncbi:MAG: hypothetical protein K2L64_03215, partial [Ureaplasma sp.]|nr:hypothetical protein [Ureaplasma sp.]
MNTQEIFTQIIQLSKTEIIKLLDLTNRHLKSLDDKKERPKKCYFCSSTKINIHSSKNQNTRYRCKECKKTFSQNYNSFFYRTKKDKYSKFLEFIELFIIGTTLEQCANKLKITLKTAFFWRHKLLCLISSYYEHSLKNSKLSNLIQIDEKYGTVCRKGRKKVNNPRKRGYSTSYSTELKKRGLSRDKYCLCTSVDENDKYSFKILGFGKPSKKSLIQYAKQNFNLNNSQIICDGDKVYYGVCYDLNIPFSIANSFNFHIIMIEILIFKRLIHYIQKLREIKFLKKKMKTKTPGDLARWWHTPL